MKSNKKKSQVYSLKVPYPNEASDGWTPIRIFYDRTECVDALWCHLSILKTGAWPHPPHKHEQEEIVLMLTGEAELIIPDAPGGRESRKVRAGNLSYYPANFAHTIKTTSEQPVNYLMLKWHNDLKRTGEKLAFSEYQVFADNTSPEREGLKTDIIFKGQTEFLKSVNCVISVLAPGAGYEPHTDDCDVIMMVLEGEVETLGQKIAPHSIIYYAAGEPHGLHNSGDVDAKYIVFEFHRWPNNHFVRILKPLLVLVNKLTDPEKWKRKFKILK